MQVLISKAGETHSVELDWAALPEASKAYIIGYGLKQALNDAHASVKTLSEAKGLVDKRLDQLIAGNPPTARTGSGKDALTRECENIAAAQLRSVGIKAGDARKAVETHGWEKVVESLATKAGGDPAEALARVEDAAQTKLDAGKNAAPAGVDLAALGL